MGAMLIYTWSRLLSTSIPNATTPCLEHDMLSVRRCSTHLDIDGRAEAREPKQAALQQGCGGTHQADAAQHGPDDQASRC